MKQFLFIIIAICFTLNIFGQGEFNSKFKTIPPLNTKVSIKPKKENLPSLDLKKLNLPKIVTPNILKETNIFGTKPKVNNSFEMGTTSGFSMIKKNDFINQGKYYADKMNEKPINEDAIVYRRNQNLGDFKTKSSIAKVMYRDYGEVDGDAIRVLLNDKPIVNGVVMDNGFQGFDITLQNGFNKIDFEALNQGRLGPNTAEFKIYDDKGNLISASQWNLATGFKATIVITKE